MASSDFKIIIAGGGIAGLTLANVLQRFDIDYVILEGHADIATPVGASIGLFPNGLRILDQLGVYEDIMHQSMHRTKMAYTRDKDANVIAALPSLFQHLERRHGYGLLFFDRQKLLQILYDHINHKGKVLLNKKVAGVEPIDGGVTVTTADGSTYPGTLVVGADGIHSRTRAVMKALGNKLQPGYFPPDEEDGVPCYYRCSFGIAQHVPGWVSGDQNIVNGDGQSQLVVSGPDERVYWFLFDRLPEVKYGKDIPKYSKEEEAEFVRQNYNLPITKEVTFGQVFDKRLSSTLTPLHEVVFKKWFFGRIITFGDSAHKPNPIGGQGANGAMESCAELVNAILRKKDSRNGSLGNLTDTDVQDIFIETQAARYDRAEDIIRIGHEMQALNAYENRLLSTIVNSLVQPLVGDEFVYGRMGEVFIGASAVEKLPIPYRLRAIPFSDERSAKPVSKRVSKYVRRAFIGSMGAIILAAFMAFRMDILHLVGNWGDSSPIVIRWFGETSASKFMNMLMSLTSYLFLDKDPTSRMHLINFLPQLISPLLIYTIEGYRLGNQGTILALPTLFMVGMQVQGIGRIAPFHAILSALYTHEETPGRAVPKAVATSLIPAITLGFVIPTVMMLLPTPNTAAWQHWSAVWQIAPLLFNALTLVFSAGIRRWQRSRKPCQVEDDSFERYKQDDVPILKSVYKYAFAVQSTVHIASLAYAWSHPGISITRMFFGLPDPFSADWNLRTVTEHAATFIRWDAATAFPAYLGGNMYSIWELRRLGYIKTKSAVKAALSVLAGQFLVGPGATWAALWSWREDVIANAADSLADSDRVKKD